MPHGLGVRVPPCAYKFKIPGESSGFLIYAGNMPTALRVWGGERRSDVFVGCFFKKVLTHFFFLLKFLRYRQTQISKFI